MATAIGEDWKRQAGVDTRLANFVVAETSCPPDDGLAQALAAAAVAGDARQVDAAVDRAFARGYRVEQLLVGPVTAAARRLGDFWVEDSCDFVAVTMAMWQFRCGVERLLDAHPARPVASGRRALFAAAPGDQHGFGSFLVNEIFTRAGWAATPVDNDELGALVAAEWIDLVGLTATAERHSGALAPAIAALRRASRNPRLAILVGGRLFADDPARAGVVGADGTARDALSALTLADRLVAPLGPPC